MQVVSCQCNVTWENKTENFLRVAQLVADLNPQPGALVVLPEMFATGFSLNVDIVAEGEAGPTETFLSELARRHRAFVVGGLVRRASDARVFNESVAFNPEGQLLCRYQKMHPFTPGGEANHVSPGVEPVSFSLGDWRVAPFICYDLRFPERFRAIAAAAQPELYIVIACWPEARIHHWVRLLQARAIENQAYVVGVNRFGCDPRQYHPGRSIVVDFHGNILSDAGTKETATVTFLELAALRDYRRDLPFLDDLIRPCASAPKAR